MAKKTRSEKIRIIIVILFACVAIAIASLTVGRDIYYDTGNNGLLSFAIVNATGYLFFLFMPVEVAFVYYLQEDINVYVLIAVAMGTALFSQAIDYLIGFSFSNKFIDKLIGRRRYEKAEASIRKYGNLTILVFNALPLSSEVILLAAGMMRHRIRDTVICTVTGLLVKYIALALLF